MRQAALQRSLEVLPSRKVNTRASCAAPKEQ